MLNIQSISNYAKKRPLRSLMVLATLQASPFYLADRHEPASAQCSAFPANQTPVMVPFKPLIRPGMNHLAHLAGARSREETSNYRHAYGAAYFAWLTKNYVHNEFVWTELTKAVVNTLENATDTDGFQDQQANNFGIALAVKYQHLPHRCRLNAVHKELQAKYLKDHDQTVAMN